MDGCTTKDVLHEIATHLTLIHYGHKVFMPDLMKPIKNEGWVKPSGGLWTSPIDSKWSWKNWCRNEDFRECSDNNCMKLKFKSNARILIIDSLHDLYMLVRNQPMNIFRNRVPDFEQIAKEYDAIWLTDKGQMETHLSDPNLYGWDCESVLIMNPNCVYQI